MNRLFSILLVVMVIVAGTSCTNSGNEVADIWNGYDYFSSHAITVKLYANNSLEVGTINYGIEQVGNSGYVTATYKLKDGWKMRESQLYVGTREDMPEFDPKNQEFATFPFVEEHAPRVSSFTQYIPVTKLPVHNPGIKISAQAFIRNLDGQEVTALADENNDLLTQL